MDGESCAALRRKMAACEGSLLAVNFAAIWMSPLAGFRIAEAAADRDAALAEAPQVGRRPRSPRERRADSTLAIKLSPDAGRRAPALRAAQSLKARSSSGPSPYSHRRRRPSSPLRWCRATPASASWRRPG